MGRKSVPDPHGHHGEKVPQVGGGALVAKPPFLEGIHHKTGVHIIPQPGGKGNVPSGPEVLHVHAEKGLVEVFRHPDAQQIPRPDGHAGGTDEVKKEKQSIAIHIR